MAKNQNNQFEKKKYQRFIFLTIIIAKTKLEETFTVIQIFCVTTTNNEKHNN